jgi:hypothetical protein
MIAYGGQQAAGGQAKVKRLLARASRVADSVVW